MVNGFARSLLVLSAALMASTSGAFAQDSARDLFDQGVQLLYQNKDAEALQKFKGAVSLDPSMADAYSIWKKTEQRVWASMMVKNDELAKVARHFLRMAQLERKRFQADEATIRAAVEGALSDDYETRVQANNDLMSNHGDYAVPYLLDALGNADEDTRQTYAILALDRIGRAATLPLVAAVQSENALLRRNAAAALYYIGDSRALPALKRLADSDADASVRETAHKAVRKIGGAEVGSALALYLQHSHDYLVGSGRLRDGDVLDGVWSFADGKLVHRPVPTSVFGLELAKESAYGALAVDPTSEAGLIALTRAYTAERAVVAAAVRSGAEDMGSLEGSLGEISITVQLAGAGIVRKAFAQSVAEGMVPAAAATLDTLAKLEDPDDLGDSPLIESLVHEDKRIRYGAAMALAGMNAKLSDAARSNVVAALSRAVLEQSVRLVAVIDPVVENRGVYSNCNSKSEGLVVEANGSTTRVLAQLATYPRDVLVIHEQLETMLVDSVLKFCKDRPHLAKMKVILVTKDPAGAQQVYGARIDEYLKTPVTVEGLTGRIAKVLEGVDAGSSRMEAEATAATAAKAIANLDPAAFPVGGASGHLVQAAQRTNDAVAVPSLIALGRAGGDGDLAGIVVVMNGSKARESVCAAAADALGRIMARSGNVNQASIDALAALARDKGLSAAIRGAAGAALGRAPILPGTRTKLLQDLRVDPSTGN